jgi:hypothetical protein
VGEDLPVVIDRVAHRFELGGLVADAVRVPGGLSNELWRLVTRDGVFAVNRMIVNADRPGFVDKVEAAFAVERRAWVAGVAMPQPVAVPGTRRALAQVEGSLPAPILADLLGLHLATAARWPRHAKRAWETYLADCRRESRGLLGHPRSAADHGPACHGRLTCSGQPPFRDRGTGFSRPLL